MKLSLQEALEYTKKEVREQCKEHSKEPWPVYLDEKRMAIVNELPTGDKLNFLEDRSSEPPPNNESDLYEKKIKERVGALIRRLDELQSKQL